ncbi:MAG: hypothetical protein QNJ45_06530 [Ardenticatenaceae bacterium]|nr:hypothetical protein [Ardenticatenaceae bacterium]
MNIGMMWLDDDQNRSLEEKVQRAADYYRQKYGKKPNVCFVNDGAIAEKLKVDKVDVLPAGHVRPQHLWIGIQ